MIRSDDIEIVNDDLELSVKMHLGLGFIVFDYVEFRDDVLDLYSYDSFVGTFKIGFFTFEAIDKLKQFLEDKERDE